MGPEAGNVVRAAERVLRRGASDGTHSLLRDPAGYLPGRRRLYGQRHLPREEMMANGWIDEDGNPIPQPGFKTPEQGAATQVWAATSRQLDGMGGVYLEDCDIAEPAVDGEERSGVMAWATDPEQAARLWALSAELTGVDAFAA